VLQDEIEDVIAEKVLRGTHQEQKVLFVSAKNGDLQFGKQAAPKKPAVRKKVVA